jgi:hypothetical protein
MPGRAALRFLPQDFHTCGKHCGKAGSSLRVGRKTAGSWAFLEGERLPNIVFALKNALSCPDMAGNRLVTWAKVAI